MTNYTRKPTPALAWQYKKERQADWPEWARKYRVATNMGQQPLGAGPGVLLVPTKAGGTINAIEGDYLVLEGETSEDALSGTIYGGILSVFKPAAFAENFAEVAEATSVVEAPEPAAEVAIPKASRAKPAADTPPAIEPTAEETPAETE